MLGRHSHSIDVLTSSVWVPLSPLLSLVVRERDREIWSAARIPYLYKAGTP